MNAFFAGPPGLADNAIAACPFCMSNEQQVYEVDGGIWAVYCANCKTIGPHTSDAGEARSRWSERK